MKILITDDHALVREGLKHALAAIEDGVELRLASDRAQTLAALQAQPDFDLLVLDLALPDVQGLDLLTEIRTRYPALPVLVCSGSGDTDLMFRCMDAGAAGYVTKSSPTEVIRGAIRLVLAGDTYVPSAMITAVRRAHRAASGERSPTLTERHREILARVAEGRSNKDIARLLGLSDATVKAHLAVIFRVLKVTNRMRAVQALRRLEAESQNDDGPA